MNSFSLSSMNPARALLLGSLLIAAGCTTPSAPTPTEPTPPAPSQTSAAPAAEGAFDDDPRPPSGVENIVIAAGLDQAKLAAAERELLAILQKSAPASAEAQEAAQQLGLVLLAGSSDSHAASLNALAPMLSDPARSDFARLALDRVPGSAIDTLYLQALTTTTGRTRLGILDTVGSRGIFGAIPALAGLLNDPDATTANAAAGALGRIGGQAALDALAQAKDPLAPAVLTARLAASAKTDPVTAARVAGEIHRNISAPLGQRTAALRALIAANPAGAIDEIHAALAGDESAFHAVAIESIASLPVTDAGARLAGRLGSYAPSAQVSLIAVLGNRHDASAVPGLLATLDGADTDVRLAAIDALGRLPGNAEVARRLALIASGKDAAAEAASTALARLDGHGLDELVRTGAASEGDDALRVVFIRQIAARNLTEAIPFLLGLRQSPVESLRLEALDALRLIAAPADQQPVIAWATGAANRAEQTRAVRALITIILRDGAVETRAAPVIAALDAGDASARQSLLPVLSRVAGAPALAAAGRLARDADDAVAKAATAELARWPDATALPVLVELVASTPHSGIRDAAAQGSARFLADRPNATPAQRSLYARQLLALPLDAAARISLLNVLSLCSDRDALEMAGRFLAEPTTAAAAQDATDAITSNLVGPPAFSASEAADKTGLVTDGRRNTFWSVPNAPGSWLRLDLHNARPVRKITLDQGRREWDWPELLEICVSDDPENSGESVAQMEGAREQTVVSLPAGTRGRYVWLRQNGTRPSNAWSIAELIVE